MLDDQSYFETDPFLDRMEAEASQRAARVVAQAEVAVPITDPAQLPHLLVPGLDIKTAEDLAKVMMVGPVLLSDMWGRKLERIQPTLLPITGDTRQVFYRQKSNSLTGEPGKGKSLMAQWAVVLEARAGRLSLYIDYEKDLDAFVQRMLDLGMTAEEASLVLYWRPTKPLHLGVVQTVVQYVQSVGLDLIVVDSVSRAMSRAALDENSNKEVRTWYETGVELMMLAGGSPVVIDHTKKPEMSGGKQVASSDRYSKGAVAKLEVITGLAAMVKTIREFSQAQAGHATVTVAKDNNGAWTEGEVMCEMHVAPVAGGSMTIELKKSTAQVVDPTTGQLKFRPTALMERVTQALNDAGKALSVTALKAAVTGKSEFVGVAIERLHEEGYVSAPPADPGKARLVSLLAMFMEAADPGPAGAPLAVRHAVTVDEPNPFAQSLAGF